jgi:predicted metal-dependent hydrolase
MSVGGDTARLPEPALSAEEDAEFARGLAQFNAGLYFECHDTLEDLWSGLRGPSREFFQGLIQVAVGFHHIGRGNPKGAASVLARGLARLERYPSRYAGLEVERLRATVRDWAFAIASGADLPGGRPAPQMERA